MSRRYLPRAWSLEPLRFLCPSKPRPPAALRCGLGACDCPKSPRWAHQFARRPRTQQHQAQIFGQGFKATRAQPALRLLLHRRPRWQIVGHHPPRTTRAHKPAQTIVEFPQGMFSLRRIFFHQRQIRRAERPFLVAHVTRITCFSCRHPKRNAGMYLQSTDIFSKKCMTGSSLLFVLSLASSRYPQPVEADPVGNGRCVRTARWDIRPRHREVRCTLQRAWTGPTHDRISA